MKHETDGAIPNSKLTVPIVGRDHIQGPADAPLTLLEYGDYQCPYCGQAYPIIKAVQKRLGARLRFAFRNFPLANSHPYAEHAAEAAEAASDQGKFWEMHDALFENQEALEDENLAAYAAALGLDAKRLLREVQSSAHLDRVREDFRSGARGGVNGTPTLFVNGVRFDGAPDVEELVAALTESTG
jgi:protein-disulfide isomerase